MKISFKEFLTFDREATEVDPAQAADILDTNIFELLPQEETRQQKIR